MASLEALELEIRRVSSESYECPHCKDSGERITTEEDKERAKKIAATDALHRTRLFERVVSLKDLREVAREVMGRKSMVLQSGLVGA